MSLSFHYSVLFVHMYMDLILIIISI